MPKHACKLPLGRRFSAVCQPCAAATACRAGATPLLLPSSVRELAADTAAALNTSQAAASNQMSSNDSRGSAWRGPFKRRESQQLQQQHQSQQQQQHNLEQMQTHILHSKQRELYAAAVEVATGDLQLTQSNHFMPPDSVLQLSEFTLPQSSSTLDFYNWLLS